MSAIVASDQRDLSAALASLGGRLASLIPAMMFGYMIVIWPLAFGDPTISPIEMQMGWMAPLPAGTGDSSPLKLVAYPVLFMLSLLCALFTASYRRLPFGNAGVLSMAAVIVLAIGSTLWSAQPNLSFARGLLLGLISTTVLLAVYSANSFRLMMRALFVVVLAATAFNLLAVATQAPGPIGHNGIYAQKNVFGWVSGMILFMGLYHVTFGGVAQRSAGLLMMVAAPLFLVLSQSKTSLGLALLAPVAGLGLLYVARRMRMSPAITVAAVTGLAVLVYFLGSDAGSWTFASMNEKLLGDATLTGRTDVWDFAMELIAARPLLGHGYEAVWGTGYDGIAYKNTLGFARIAPTGHNGYIDMLVHLGILGLALKTIFLLSVLASAGRLARLDPRLGWLALTIVVFVLLHNNLESDVMISSNPLSMLLMLFLTIGLRLTGHRRG